MQIKRDFSRSFYYFSVYCDIFLRVAIYLLLKISYFWYFVHLNDNLVSVLRGFFTSEEFSIWIGWFIKLSVHTFQTIIVIYRMGNFVYHHWRCTSIYRPLSYSFRSLRCLTLFGSIVACPLLMPLVLGVILFLICINVIYMM